MGIGDAKLKIRMFTGFFLPTPDPDITLCRIRGHGGVRRSLFQGRKLFAAAAFRTLKTRVFTGMAFARVCERWNEPPIPGAGG
jgi:hypothetical protein